MKTRNQKGITLIALIITIIVMLILVGVSVSVALNTGLFKTAQGAAKNTELARQEETALSNGAVTVEVDGEKVTYDSMDAYLASLKGESDSSIVVAENPTHILTMVDMTVSPEVEYKFKIDANTTFEDIIDKSPDAIKSKWSEANPDGSGPVLFDSTFIYAFDASGEEYNIIGQLFTDKIISTFGSYDVKVGDGLDGSGFLATFTLKEI